MAPGGAGTYGGRNHWHPAGRFPGRTHVGRDRRRSTDAGSFKQVRCRRPEATKRVKLGPGRSCGIRYPEADLEAWLQERLQQSA